MVALTLKAEGYFFTPSAHKQQQRASDAPHIVGVSLHQPHHQSRRRMNVRQLPFSRFALSLLLVLIACWPPTYGYPGAGVTVTVDPLSVTVPVGGTRQLTTQVIGAKNTAVTWSVNGITGGNSTVGTINSAGLYTAPAIPPAGWIVIVRAAGVADPSAFATCTVTVRNQIPYVTVISPNLLPPGPFALTVTGSRFVNGAQVLWNGLPLATTFVSSTQLTATGNAMQLGNASVTVSNPGPGAVSTPLTVSVVSSIVVTVAPSSVNVQAGGTQQFQAVVSGTSNHIVTWKVNGTVGGDPTFGTITPGGLYTAPAVIPVAGTATIAAVSAIDGVTQGTATVNIQDPLAITYGRFLDQSTFGPTPQLTAHVRQVGMQAFLDEQFAMPESSWPALNTATRQSAVDSFFLNAATGQDQLRQRAVFGLSEIIVISMNKNTNGNEIVPWLQLLSRNVFGNYRTLLREITLDASMGKFLDLANSAKPTPMTGANENYAREVMQLFSMGLYVLNVDGSVKLDGQGQPIPTYTQTDVRQVALALTGWTYGNPSGIPPAYGNYNYYPGPMLPIASKHDTTAKNILGHPLPAGQTIVQDLDGAIDIIFNHPNVGPFVATRLIRTLVTSNPSPAYISRVAPVFNDNGQSVRGDMKAVIQAILLDPDARNDSPPSDFGRLRTPVQHTIALMRALNLPVGQPSQFAYIYYSMSEGMLDAPSVFGHYSPMFRVPKTPLFGPEFQIYSPTDAVDNALLQGRMSVQTRAALLNAMPAMYDNSQRVLTALYLTATSGDYLIQH
jgi:uncharacterized protein (DUF1800 family)